MCSIHFWKDCKQISSDQTPVITVVTYFGCKLSSCWFLSEPISICVITIPTSYFPFSQALRGRKYFIVGRRPVSVSFCWHSHGNEIQVIESGLQWIFLIKYDAHGDKRADLYNHCLANYMYRTAIHFACFHFKKFLNLKQFLFHNSMYMHTEEWQINRTII